LQPSNHQIEQLGVTPLVTVKVKTVMASFEPSSVYGNRVAWQELVLVTSQDGKNIFHRTPLWRQGLISDILMLPRGEMVKPPRAEGAKYGGEGRFTKVQEMKQAVLFSKHGPPKL